MNVEITTRILTIDDEAFIRTSIRNYLEDCGFEVIEAENGRSGIDKLEGGQPDLVLLDLRMPEMDGLQVLEIIKRLSPDTPVIVASGTGNISSVVEALHLGAWDYILKPIQDMSVLLHSVKKCLKESRLKRENKAYQEHLEKLVRERTQSLAASEQLYRAMFECTGTATAILEKDMTLSMVNTGFEQLSGLQRHEIIGKKKWMDFVAPPDLDKMRIYHENRRTLGSAERVPEQYEFLFLTANREERSILVHVGMIPGTDQSIASLLDITHRKEAEQRWQSLEIQLRKAQKMEAIGTLAGGIAHDLNNILSPVLGYADMIMGSAKPGGVTFARSEKIQRAALRAADLVNQILSFTRTREEKKRPVKIHPIAREVLRLLRGSIPSTIRIIDRIDRNCGRIEADLTQIHQVILNLCTNAYHAMEDTGGELAVALFEKVIEQRETLAHPGLMPGRFLCLEVTDTGCGIPEAYIERIFDPYYTTKEEGKGTGLGLATVYGIVKSCRGEVLVRSTPGKGSCFTLLFPMVEVVSQTETFERTPPFDGRQARGLGILVVDDDRAIADMCKEGLEALGYDVTVYYSGMEALAFFRKNFDKIDFAITDQTMPHMTGFDLSRGLLAVKPDLPVILCSGYPGAVNEQKARDAGIRRFVMKPVTVGELSRTIQEVLKGDRHG